MWIIFLIFFDNDHILLWGRNKFHTLKKWCKVYQETIHSINLTINSKQTHCIKCEWLKKYFLVNHKKDIYIAFEKNILAKVTLIMKRNLQTGRKQTSTLLDHILEPCEKTVPLTVQKLPQCSSWCWRWCQNDHKKADTNRALKLQDCNREQQEQSVCFLVNDAVQY